MNKRNRLQKQRGNGNTPSYTPSPSLPPSVEGNEDGKGDNYHENGNNKTCTAKKHPHWTAYIEAACAVFLVIITGLYTHYAYQQAGAAIVAANAAKSAADTAKNTLEISQRPWVSLDLQPISDLSYNADNVAYIKFRNNAVNRGLTPAVNAKVDSEVVELPIVKDAQREADRFCQSLLPPSPKDRDVFRSILRQTIFPQIPAPSEGFKEFVPHPMGKGVYFPIVIGCVVYQSSFEQTWFQTWKIYSLEKPSNIPGMPDTYVLPSVGEVIKMKDIMLIPFMYPEKSN